MEKERAYLWVFVALFVFSAVMIFIENDFFTGRASTESTTSSVTISQYFSISLSPDLSTGIDFGTQNSTSATNLNATGNYNASDESSYYISVSSDSNSDVNFSVWADGSLNTTGGDEILLGNESYHYSTTNDANNPDIASEVSFTQSEVDAGSEVGPGSNIYYRFWLDIPAGTPVGTYNNTVNFKGVAA